MPAAPGVQYLARAVEKTVNGPAGALTILRSVNLGIRAGESLAIVGASGSGKSTLLHILGALDRPSAGSVLFEGRDLASLSPAGAASFRNRELGFVFQFHHLLPEFTTVENVAMQAIIGGMARSRALRLAEAALERVGLAERRDHSVTTLSGGERQRAAIARATLLGPRVLLADEPTGNLDGATGERVVQLLLELNRGLGMTLVVVTHNRDLAARMGRSLELRSGELYEQSPV
ncbi:MAG: ABC transporter ATP-binding protein [Desulfovibrionaceae bacterium]|nr:ABC transporter ATP-binding protein [Desulfovibrionaceae bacterium]